MTSYHVRFWDIKKISDTARGRHRVRWAAGGREHCKSFTTKALADAFLGTLEDAARDETPFDPVTGQPARLAPARAAAVTWYEHARAYSQMKWPDLAAKSRRSAAEALTTITVALTGPRRGAPDPAVLRRALFGYAFNHATATRITPAEITRALDWIAKASPPVAALDDPDTIRAVLAACARRLDGTPAAAATARRKRAVLASALGYAVERRLLPASPWPASNGRPPRSPKPSRPPLRRQPGPGRPAAGRRPPARTARRAHGSVLRLPVLRRAAPVGGRGQLREPDLVLPDSTGWAGSTWLPPAPAPEPGGPTTAPPPGTRPQAPAAWRDPRPSPSRPPWSNCSATTSSGTGPGRAAGCSPPAPRRAAQRHRLRRSLGTRPAGCADPRPAGHTAGPPPLRPAARRRVLVAQRRRARHRRRPPRRPRPGGPAPRLRQLHRRPGHRRQPAHPATPSTTPAAYERRPRGIMGQPRRPKSPSTTGSRNWACVATALSGRHRRCRDLGVGTGPADDRRPRPDCCAVAAMRAPCRNWPASSTWAGAAPA